MVERQLVLSTAHLTFGSRVLEVGSGGHAIATVPLAHALGPGGRVVAVERGRWGRFRAIVRDARLEGRVRAVQGDARRLPLPANSVDVALCVHGLRSLGSEADPVRTVREMLRVAPWVFLAESLPVAHTAAQRAHLTFYGLRAEMLRARTRRADDRPYLPLGELTA
ncbi:MAG TPA: methyltransferase domain-containing protein [Thermoplasmata archaeon]|nr:methyltransferase domain-containing protein [Thermoplasmata archaeon]